MNHLVYELERLVTAHRNTPNVEIEIRLGWQRPDKFDTDIGQTYYDTIRHALHNSVMRDTRSTQNTHVYTFKNMRMITDERGNPLNMHKKVKIESVDFLLHGTPFDVRLSVCTELPVRDVPTTPFQFLRSRVRESWSHNEWTYDLTRIVRSQPDNEYIDTLNSYECELELKPLKAGDDTPLIIAQSGVMKLCDLLQINPNDQSVISQIQLNRKEKNHLKKKNTVKHNKHNNRQQWQPTTT
jgi:hypothetical protein